MLLGWRLCERDKNSKWRSGPPDSVADFFQINSLILKQFFFFFVSYRWAFGIVLWEICTLGKVLTYLSLLHYFRIRQESRTFWCEICFAFCKQKLESKIKKVPSLVVCPWIQNLKWVLHIRMSQCSNNVFNCSRKWKEHLKIIISVTTNDYQLILGYVLHLLTRVC